MKKGIITLIVAVVALITTGVWFVSTQADLKLLDFLTFGIVIAFAVFLGYKKLSSVKRGEPAEDELSKKIVQKTAAWSYYVSLYLWLAIMYFSDRFNYETHTFIGAGILGMAVTFAVCWVVLHFRGIRNE
jgi:peptidoglycan/LPS O-acetylase OafA/YrhL